MLSCMATYRCTDKKPCGNILNSEPVGKLIKNIDFGGDAMKHSAVNCSSLTSSIDAFVNASKTIKAVGFTEALGK